MKNVPYTQGKEVREVDVARRTLEEIQAEFRCCDWRNSDHVMENINAALEPYGLEIVQGHAPDSNIWVKVESIKEEETA